MLEMNGYLARQTEDVGFVMVQVFSFSEVGGHRVNEDAFCVQPHPLTADNWLCFLADGQGGRAGGGAAAQLACRSGLDIASKFRSESLIDRSIWPDILRQADLAVEADVDAGYTTLIGLCASGKRIAGASSGDSAVLLVNKGKAVHLTSAQHKNPPVGSGAAIFVPFEAEVEAPWSILVMSDGVWKYAGWDRVADVAVRQRGPTVLEALQECARLPRSGQFPDDFTVVLLEDAK